MTCADARRLLLSSDPAALASSSGGDLALHLATCASCHAAAALLLEAQGELARALDPPPDQDGRDAVGRALATARRRRDDARHRRWTLPLAAAAVVAGLMVMRSGGRVLPPPIQPVVAPAAGHGITVAAPRGRNVAVLQTDNPNIVIIWFF